MGVITTSATMGARSSSAAKTEGPRKSWPHKNTMMANRRVSSRGSFEGDVALSLQPTSSLEKRPRAVSHKARKAQEGPQNERCAGGATDVKPSVLGTRQRVCEHGCTFVKNGAHVACADR